MIVEYNIENEEGILIQGKGNYCLKLKKGKLKTRNLLNVTILGEHTHKTLTDMNRCLTDPANWFLTNV